jgi:uncharacterized repeat protein (TIGR02543 family)
MKRYSYFWLALGMAILMLLPIYSMAQTPLKLRLMTETTGDMITTNEPKIKSFFFSHGDGTLSIVLQDSLNFTFAETDTLIALRNPSNCTLPGDGSVVATAGGTFSFEVYSPNATVLNPIFPGGSFSSGRFQWTVASADVGTYLAVFEAQATGLNKSQLVVMIKVVPPGYTLTVSVPGGGGSVTKSPDKPTYNISPVETVSLTAIPNAGYFFGGWSGDLTGTANPASVAMDRNKVITATFTQTSKYTLTTSVTPAGAGSISLNPAGGVYDAGTVVTVTATPAPGSGYNFTGWSGDASGSQNPFPVTMNGNKTITANFSTSPLIPPGTIPLDTLYPTWGNYIGKDQQSVAQGETKYYSINLTTAKSSLTLNTWTLSSYTGSLSYKVYNPNGKLIATPQAYGEEISMQLYFDYKFCDALGNLQTYNSPSVQPEGLIPGLYLVEVKYVSGNPYFRIGWKATDPDTPTCAPPGR